MGFVPSAAHPGQVVRWPSWTCLDTKKRRENGDILGHLLWPNCIVLSLMHAGGHLSSLGNQKMNGVWTSHSVTWSRSACVSSLKMLMIV